MCFSYCTLVILLLVDHIEHTLHGFTLTDYLYLNKNATVDKFFNSLSTHLPKFILEKVTYTIFFVCKKKATS